MTNIYEKQLGQNNGNTNFIGDKLIVEYIHSSVSNEICRENRLGFLLDG